MQVSLHAIVKCFLKAPAKCNLERPSVLTLSWTRLRDYCLRCLWHRGWKWSNKKTCCRFCANTSLVYLVSPGSFHTLREHVKNWTIERYMHSRWPIRWNKSNAKFDGNPLRLLGFPVEYRRVINKPFVNDYTMANFGQNNVSSISFHHNRWILLCFYQATSCGYLYAKDHLWISKHSARWSPMLW